MIELPTILKIDQTENQVTLTLLVPENLPYFEGHFPEHPVLPGVVQLRWAEELAREYGLVSQPFNRVDKLKFLRIIGRGFEVALQLRLAADGSVSFQYDSEHGKHSSGKLVFN